jgi:RNA polymerase sigma factor (sigma-70 family)
MSGHFEGFGALATRMLLRNRRRERFPSRHILKHAIDQLSPKLRRAFQIYYVDGVNVVEASQVLGLPLGTVKDQVARARAQLTRYVRQAFGMPSEPVCRFSRVFRKVL